MMIITQLALNTGSQQPEQNKIGARVEDRLTVLRNAQKHLHNIKSATTKDSLFYGRQHTCAQGYNPPTVKGQFDDAEDTQDIADKEKDVALTLLNARNITAGGYATSITSHLRNTTSTASNLGNATSITSNSRVIDNTSANIGPSSPVSPHDHRSHHSQHQYHANYHSHQQFISLSAPSSQRALNYTYTPNGSSTTKGEREGTGTRGARAPGQVRSLSTGIESTMNRYADTPRLSCIPPRDSSLSSPKIVDGTIWEGPDPPKSNPIYNPNLADVLFGRGGAVNTHPGNVFFRSQVTQHHDRYTKARNHAEKSCVVRFIRDAIKARGGRFLRCKTASKIWYTVDDRDATVKTMQSLRDVKTANVAGESLEGISSHSTETFGLKPNATESNNHHENTNVNWNQNGWKMPVTETSYSDRGPLITSIAASSATTVNGRSQFLSLPSKKRPVNLERTLANPHMFASNELEQHDRRRKKPNLSTSTSLPHTATPPPTTEISFVATATPGTVVKSLPLKKSISHKESSSSSTDHINYITLQHHQQQKQQQQQLQQQQHLLRQEQQYPPTAKPNLKNITLLRPEDVLSGRGGGTNRHPGNIHFRLVVSQAQPNYIKSRKKDKSIIARNIVQSIRNKNGRFLKFHAESGLWHDVGNKKATEKTSQALREGLAGSNGSGDFVGSSVSADDATTVANIGIDVACSNKIDKQTHHHSQNRLSVRTVSVESASLSGESQEDSYAPNWSAGNFLNNGNGATMHLQQPHLQQWGNNCNNGKGSKTGVAIE